jgi:hypothetical protein
MTVAPHAPCLAAAHAAPRCGAERKYDGCPCQNPAMENGLCVAASRCCDVRS